MMVETGFTTSRLMIAGLMQGQTEDSLITDLNTGADRCDLN